MNTFTKYATQIVALIIICTSNIGATTSTKSTNTITHYAHAAHAKHAKIHHQFSTKPTHKHATHKLLYSHIHIATRNNALLNADNAYQSNDQAVLHGLYANYPNNEVIAYLYAKMQLRDNKNNIASTVIDSLSDGYMKNDLLHKLMNDEFLHADYANYIKHYSQLYNTGISLNEQCGFAMAMIMTKGMHSVNENNIANTNNDSDYDTLTATNTINLFNANDNNYLAANDIPNNCIVLFNQQYNQGKLTNSLFKQFLYTIAINDQLSKFRQIAIQYNQPKVLDALFDAEGLQQQLAIVHNISTAARKNALAGLTLFKQYTSYKSYRSYQSSLIDTNAIVGIANYVAMQLAKQQNFKEAVRLFNAYPQHDHVLSNDIWEWKARSYLASGNTRLLIDTIIHMPTNLRSSNTWLYWLSYAYAKEHKEQLANIYLKQITRDYSYYSLLAYSKMEQPIYFIQQSIQQSNTPDPTQFKQLNRGGGNTIYISDQSINECFAIYKLATQNNAQELKKIALFQWYYIARLATDKQLLMMNKMALDIGAYDLAIYAAQNLSPRYLELSFPMPFWYYYRLYSNANNIPASYLLAISRQESRFNKSVIAFDGGLGLMQLMPNTASYIRRKAHLRQQECTSASTRDVNCNIKLGSWYLASLFDKLGSYIYTTASYNAGPNRASRWQKNLHALDNDIQIELIPIDITRKYVQNVLTNKAIYDDLTQQNTLLQPAHATTNRYSVNLYQYINHL